MTCERKPTKLRCVMTACKWWDMRAERNCSNWCPSRKCGFKDVKDAEKEAITRNKLAMEAIKPVGPEDYERILDEIHECRKKVDMVNEPPHYLFMKGIEVKDIIVRAIQLNFISNGVRAGWYWQTLKYLLRCGRKDNLLEDLKKSRFYLNELIKEVETNG